MTSRLTSPRRGSPLLWLAGAVVLWLAAAVVDRRTEVVIATLGDHLRFAVAGTELVLPGAIRSVSRVTLHATASIDPPGGEMLEISHAGGVDRILLSWPFRATPDDHAPVGDWWVDARTPERLVADREVEIAGDFSARTVLRGRFGNDLTITLIGQPSASFTLRRGLLDNYLLIRDGEGTLLDVTTLDPTPGADLLATVAQILRAAAAACLLVAFVSLVSVVLPGDGESAASPRAEGPSRNPPRRYALTAALGLAVIGAATSAWVAADILGGLPHQIDEVVYLLQARWLLDGDIAPAASAFQHHLRVPFTYLVEGRWIGHYPVGWPAFLALGLAAGAPQLVSVIFGIALIVLLFLVGREIDDEVTGLAAAALAVVSPLARLLCGSMFPHAATAVLVLLAVWFLLLSRRLEGWWFGAGAGAALGCCLAVRPMTAVASAIVLGGWLAVEAVSAKGCSRSRRVTLASAAGAGLLTCLPTLAHNAAVTGKALSLPYVFAKGAMYGPDNIPFGIRNLDAILISTSSSLTGWGWPLVTGGIALALPLALVGMPFLLRRMRTTDLLLLALLVIVALGHFPTRANGLHGFGARYVFDVAGCLFLLIARGFRELARSAATSTAARRTVVGLFLILNLTALTALPPRLGLYRGYYDVTGEMQRQLTASGIERAVILVAPDDWWPWGEGARLITGPRRHEIVLAADLDDNSAIERAFPDWPLLRWDGKRLRPEDGGGD